MARRPFGERLATGAFRLALHLYPAAFRDEYVTNFPVAAGTCDPGFCDSPLVNDFLGSKATMQIDAQASYTLNERLSVSIEGLNLNNQTDNRWAYGADHLVTQYSSSGPQVFFGLRYKM